MDGNEYTCDSCGLKSAEPMWRDFSHLKNRVVSHCDDCCSYVEVRRSSSGEKAIYGKQ